MLKPLAQCSVASLRPLPLSIDLSPCHTSSPVKEIRSKRRPSYLLNVSRTHSLDFGSPTISASCLPEHVDPTVIYIARHPFLTARLEDYSHNQISDKVFEGKACKALERHLNKSFAIRRRIPDNPTRPDGWRILAGEKDVAEWEGVWVGHDGHVYFLEAKHFMDADKLYGIRRKLVRSLDFLGIDRSKATIYVAGNHWLGDDTMDGARTLDRFGVLTCNGLDLDVQEPITT